MINSKAKNPVAKSASRVLAAEHNPWTSTMIALLALLVAALIAPALGAATTELESEGYGFVSRVEGDALLSGLEGDDAIEAEINHPLLTGDQITTNSGRLELVLPDATVIRVDRGSSLVFESIAGAPDSESESGTFIYLDQGELQINTPETFLFAEDLVIQTPNATVYLGSAGSYRLATQGSSFTEVVVREGFAEAETLSGSRIARDGDALEISGQARPFVNLVAAGPADSLELWAGDLDRAAYRSTPTDVDPRLAYAAAPLQESGEWIEVDSYRAWRPYVRADWRPFRYGRWVYTPSGLTWVASAPWGWVTSHYGLWDYVPGYGWLWRPGEVYSPARVFWYWGPTHVAWVPFGYYNRHHRSGLRFGVYGWAGGDWGYWADWTFCPTRYFGRRGYDRYWNSGRNLARERRFAVPRGIVTTDTRGLGPERWGKPTEALDTLVRRVDPEGRVRNLPDVTEFVARRKLAETRTWSKDSTSLSTLGSKLSVRERLEPLDRERNLSRLKTRSVVDRSSETMSGSRVRSSERSTSSRIGSPVPRVTDRTRSQAGVKRPDPMERPSSRVRSVAGRRIEPRDKDPRSERPSAREPGSSSDRSVPSRSTAVETPPVRRVLDSIRAHRLTARGSSSTTSRDSSQVKPSGSSSRPTESKPGSVTNSSIRNSSKAPARSSDSSARDSGSSSSRSSAKPSSPPPRSSKGSSSGGGSRSRSRSRSKN